MRGCLCIILFCLFLAHKGFAVRPELLPPVLVKGKVHSADNSWTLPGVSIREKNGTARATTKADGTFQIAVSGSEAILVFSFIGFESQEVALNGRTELTVRLVPTTADLDEVVVVGYSTQKKVNLTGAVQTLRLDSVVNTPVTNSAQLMYGRFSGVQLTQGSGLAGNDGSAINIRGLGTFGNSNPLIVIDGMQFDGMNEFNRLAPSDIETISVLKDASAGAIYGARGANGVIVVTTKQGSSKSFKVEYNNYIGYQKPTVVADYLNAQDYAELINERYRNLANGGAFNPRYTEEQLQKINDGSDPAFANTNWAAASLKDAPVMNHQLALSGGRNNTTYRLSMNYLSQEAIVKGKFNSDRYNFRVNLNSKVKNWLTISNNLSASLNKIRGPFGGLDVVSDIIYSFWRNAPTIPLRTPAGGIAYNDGASTNVNYSYGAETQFLYAGFTGNYVSSDYNFNDRFSAKIGLTKSLSVESAVTLNGDFFDSSNFRPVNQDAAAQQQVTQVNRLANVSGNHYRVLTDNVLRFNKNIRKHSLGAIAGFSTIYDKYDGFGAALENFPSNSLQEFDAGGTLNPSVWSGNTPASENAIQSFFGRMNYNYGGKYLLELNLRRDGSSRFGPGNRYGVFPSVSLGWRISEERFMKGLMSNNVLTNLKIRGSWGRNGNNGIGNYVFSQTYNAGLDYILGTSNVVVSGVALTSLANPNIKWETSEQYDIGLDASFFKNKLTLEADYYNKNSYDILYTNFPIPSTLGVTTLAAQNSASMRNRGAEMSLNYTERKGALTYSLGANVTRNAKNKVTSLGTGIESVNFNTIIREGVPYNAYYGYTALGIFQTQEEVQNWPKQFSSLRTSPGDIKYADLSGPAGVPDGIVDTYDRTVIGNPYPLWLYGFNGNVNYKGIGLSFVLQGVGKVDRLMRQSGAEPFDDERSNSLSYWINRWTPENPSTTLPRIGGANNDEISTFYIVDASYLRLKNIELGYSLPKQALRKLHVSGLRLFVAGQNLVTFTKLENFDPERNAAVNPRVTPLYKIYTAGINLDL